MTSELILSSEFLLWIGVAITSVTLLHAMVMLFSAMNRQRVAARQKSTELELLTEKVRAKRIHRVAESERIDHVWSGFRKFQISQKDKEGGGIASFYLTPHDGKPMPSFKPGQYLTFRLKVPNSAKPIIRCYSLSDSPKKASDYYRVSIKKIPPPRDKPELPSGVSSSYFHDSLEVGDILDVRTPSGNFFLDEEQNTPVVLIGGGVGITPVLSMLNAICDRRSNREVWFFYGVRNRDEHIMVEHLKQIEAEHDNVHLRVCYSQPGDEPENERNYHHGEMVSVDLFKRCLPSNNFDFYICGPPPMMTALVNDLGEWGVPEQHIHFEAFGPASVKKVTPPSEQVESAPACTVEFARSGKRLEWQEGKGTVLEIAEAAGIEIDSGCRAGSCGTCMTAIKAGEVRYLDTPSASLESGSCLPCIAVPKTDVTIDA